MLFANVYIALEQLNKKHQWPLQQKKNKIKILILFTSFSINCLFVNLLFIYRIKMKDKCAGYYKITKCRR